MCVVLLKQLKLLFLCEVGVSAYFGEVLLEGCDRDDGRGIGSRARFLIGEVDSVQRWPGCRVAQPERAPSLQARPERW